jgi:LacI family transcriptional regulator
MPLNLEDIARHSGVSRSTVSRVINNDPNVNEKTRAHVQAVIRQLNFQPNLAARSLASGRTRVLGLVIPQGVAYIFTEPYFSILIQSISQTCNALDHSIMLWLAEPDYERRAIQHILHGGLIDGVIVSSMLTDDAIVQALIEAQKPFMLIGRHPTNPQVNYVDADNRGGAQLAVKHLLALGHRRIGLITGPLNTIASQDRMDGYKDAVREFQLELEPSLLVESDYTEAGGFASAQKLLQEEVTAIFAVSDTMAVGALRAINANGQRVPEDVALIGFDDMNFAPQLQPALTTVRQPITQLGATAVTNLIAVLDGGETPVRQVNLPTELVIRASCGALIQRVNLQTSEGNSA